MRIRNFAWKLKMIMLMMCIAMCGTIARAEQITTPDQIYQNNVEKYNSERTDVSALSYYLLDRPTIPVPEIVAQFARELVKDCADDMEKLQVIHDWVAGNIGYDFYGYYGNGTYTIDPYLVFEKRVTICEGYSLLTASMCRAVGIPCKVVTGYANGSCQSDGGWTEEIIAEVTSGPGHAWNEAYVEGRWVILDTTWDSKVQNTVESEALLHKNEYVQMYFDPSMEEFSKDHLIMDTGDWEIEDYYDFRPYFSSVENGIKVSWEKLESNTVYTLQYSSSPFDDYIDYATTKETSIVFDKTKVLGDTLYFRIYATGSTYFPDLYSEYHKWEKPQYDVVFMDGSNAISRQKVDCWQPATAPDYKKEGYTLEWDRDYQCICSNVTVCAKWTKNASDIEPDNPLKDNADKKQDLVDKKDKVTSPGQVKKLKLKNSKGRKAVIQWQKMSGAAGYQVQYSTSKAFKKAKNVYVKKNKYTAKKLKKNNIYYIRVRAYRVQAGNKIYGKWSKKGKVRIRK